MPKTKLCPHSTSDTKEARLMALKNFTPGTRVRHQLTGKQGLFCELNLGYALPEVWVQFESNTDIRVPTSCNPLELELLESAAQKPEKISSEGKSASTETAITVETTATTVEVLEELTEDEVSERHRLELKVERAFYEAGKALRELHGLRLYRSTHQTFEEYCQDRFGFNRMTAHFKIAAATVFENLYTNGIQTLPTSERQVRELAALEADEQCSVWEEALEQANGKVPSGRIVKGIVERLKEKSLSLATNFCCIGDVFTLIRLEGTERKYNGCWAIASEVRDFTVVVDVYDTTLTVRPENLNSIDLPDIRHQLPQTLKRIKMLRNIGLLDRGAYHVLEGLGRHTYLTDFEADLLTFVEQRYGIFN